MDKMICLEAKECKKCQNLPTVRYHTEPHEHNSDCDNSGDCPACIPYKPEATCIDCNGSGERMYIDGIVKCNICSGTGKLHSEKEPQLYILPKKEAMPKPIYYNRGGYDDTASTSGYKDGINTVYSQAKEVDIDSLADAIGTEIDPWSIRIVATIKQAITDYIGRV